MTIEQGNQNIHIELLTVFEVFVFLRSSSIQFQAFPILPYDNIWHEQNISLLRDLEM